LQVVSTGNEKLLVGLKDNSKLNIIKPDMNKVAKISTELGVSGLDLSRKVQFENTQN
jgi:predicted PhzF superfamily epimerase YddE/YHI9